MDNLPEPVVKETRMTKESDYDPKIIADAYERFLNGDSLDTIVIETEIPSRVLGYHARRDNWVKRKAELTDSFRQEAGGGMELEPLEIEDARTVASRVLDSDDLERAWTEGRTMILEQAVDYAREIERLVSSNPSP